MARLSPSLLLAGILGWAPALPLQMHASVAISAGLTTVAETPLSSAPALPENLDLRGVWTGLVQGDTYETTGRFRVVLNRFGRGSGSLRIGDEPNCVVGMWVQPDGTILRVGGDPDMGINLRVIVRGSLPAIVGTVSDDGHTVPVELVKAEPAGLASVPGAYTAAFANMTPNAPLAVGVAGAGVVRVGKRGQVYFLGRLADGTVIAQGTTLDAAGQWQFFDRTAAGAILSGAVTFASQPNADFTGSLTLRLPAAPAVPEETLALSLVGSRYVPSQGFGASGSWTARTSTGLAIGMGAAEAHGPLRAAAGGNDPRGSLWLDPASGVIRGSFRDPANQRGYSMLGVVFQKTLSGAGLIRRGDAVAGTFTLESLSNANSGSIKIGAGSLTLNGGATFSGGTLTLRPGGLVLNGGQLAVGSINSDTLTLAPGFSVNPSNPPLNASGSVGGVIVNNGGILNPGTSPGTLTGGTLIPNGGINLQNGTTRIVIAAPSVPAHHFENIHDAATVVLGAAADAPSYTGAQFKALLAEARARGEQTITLGAVTFDLQAPRPIVDL